MWALFPFKRNIALFCVCVWFVRVHPIVLCKWYIYFCVCFCPVSTTGSSGLLLLYNNRRLTKGNEYWGKVSQWQCFSPLLLLLSILQFLCTCEHSCWKLVCCIPDDELLCVCLFSCFFTFMCCLVTHNKIVDLIPVNQIVNQLIIINNLNSSYGCHRFRLSNVVLLPVVS